MLSKIAHSRGVMLLLFVQCKNKTKCKTVWRRVFIVANIAWSLCKKDHRKASINSDQPEALSLISLWLKQGEKQQFVSIHAKTDDPNQACKLSSTVLITMLISTSLLCLSPTNASSAATVSKSSLCWAQIPLLPTKRMCFEDMCECVVNVNVKMCLPVVLCLCSPVLLFSHTVSSLTTLFPDSFCLSLQLEVLHSQTLMLIRERWGDLVQEERYVPAKYLTLVVWK